MTGHDRDEENARAEAELLELLSPYPGELRLLVQDLRGYLVAETDPYYELVALSAQSLNIGYGFTTKAWDCYGAIIVYRRHVNLSLPSGAGLRDPEGLLHGVGKRVRHLKLKSPGDLQTPAAVEILKQARWNAFFPVRGEARPHEGVRTVIKRGRARRG